VTFLLRFWPYLLGGVLVVGAAVWINRLGYESGYNASEAHWKPAFDAARTALVEANARTQQMETASRALTQKAEAEHAQTLASLQVRAADADVRIRGLMRDIAKRSGCRSVPAVPEPAAVADGASAGAERAERAGAGVADVGRRCEADAATLTALQRWVREQQAIR
jgi:hypothetical protein